MSNLRHVYTITKGSEKITGYLFVDNVLWWESQGYTVTRS